MKSTFKEILVWKAAIPFLIMIAFLSINDSSAQTSSPQTKVVQTFYNPYRREGVHEQYSVLISNPAIKQGAYKELSTIEVVLQEGRYNNDLKAGKWTYRSEKGLIYKTENYNQKGQLEGLSSEFTYGVKPDMAWNAPLISHSCNYKNDQKSGEEKEWYCESGENYTLKSVGSYIEDKKNGLWTYYRENGEVEKTVTYKEDIEYGVEAKQYDNHGTLLGTYSKTTTDTGLLRKVYELYIYPNGNKKVESISLTNSYGTLKGYTGTPTTWYKNGQTESRLIMSPDLQTCSYEEYYPSGKLKVKGTKFLDGTQSDYYYYGKYEKWYENGNKKDECFINRTVKGTKSGHEISWYENGNKMEEGNWVSRDPNGDLPNQAFGWCEWSEDGHNLTEEKYLQSLARDSADGNFADCLALGVLYAQIKEYPKAITIYKKYVAHSPRDYNSVYNIACFYSLMADRENALKYFGISLELCLTRNMSKQKPPYQDFYNHIQTDTDLDFIRSTSEFKTLMEKYSPDSKQ